MVIVDTGFWLALANRNDQYHVPARRQLAQIREPLITTWPVVTETCYILLHRLGGNAQRAFIDSYVAGAFELFDLTPAHGPRISELMRKYESLPMDLADASLVIVAETIGEGRILSTDTRDFGTYRWKSRKPFRNLLKLD